MESKFLEGTFEISFFFFFLEASSKFFKVRGWTHQSLHIWYFFKIRCRGWEWNWTTTRKDSLRLDHRGRLSYIVTRRGEKTVTRIFSISSSCARLPVRAKNWIWYRGTSTPFSFYDRFIAKCLMYYSRVYKDKI